MVMFPSKEWVEEVRKITEFDPEIVKAGADMEESSAVGVIEAEPGKLEKPFIYYLRGAHGKVLEACVLNSVDEKQASYVIRAPYSVLKKIIKKELDGLQALMKGQIKIKGDMQKLLKYAKYQQLGLQVLTKIKTEFIDDK